MDNEKAIKIFELDRCIECGCCVAACGTALMRKDFIGATAINRMARFYIDPRDERTPADYYELIGDDMVYSAAWDSSAATASAPRAFRCRISSASCAAWSPCSPSRASSLSSSARNSPAKSKYLPRFCIMEAEAV